MASDPYVYPATEVLRNKLDLRDADELAEAEADLTKIRAAQLADQPILGNYDLAHLQRFHAHLFGDLYDWAGEIRTVTIAKNEMFALPQFVESYASESLGRLANEDHLQGLRRDEFVTKAAGYLGDINAAHPFREGNGRTQRAFFGQLANKAGYAIAWDRIDPDRNIEASIAAMRGVERPMRELLANVTTGFDQPTARERDRARQRDRARGPRNELDEDLGIDL